MTKRNRSRWLLLPGLILILVLTACGSSSSASATASASATGSSASQKTGTTDTITIKNFMFSPDSLTVAPGAVVTVRNEDSVTHTLTDKTDQSTFNTGPVGPNQSKAFKAPGKAGSYLFFCTIHQYMTGTLVVR
ncbi:MAG TPA: cupredoxin domain-containing protein [Trebonia sp.]